MLGKYLCSKVLYFCNKLLKERFLSWDNKIFVFFMIFSQQYDNNNFIKILLTNSYNYVTIPMISYRFRIFFLIFTNKLLCLKVKTEFKFLKNVHHQESL